MPVASGAWCVYLSLPVALAMVRMPDAAGSSTRTPRIVWDQSTVRLLREGGCYARIRRLDRKRLLAAYELGGAVRVSFSDDAGRTWGGETEVVHISYGNAANPELVILDSQHVLLLYNERPTDGKHPFAIAACASADAGKTWSAPRVLYAAGTRFGDGCWEPAGVRMPGGDVWVVFANEGPYPQTDEQEITLVRSRDGGNTWSDPRCVSFRPGGRDGMPVPMLDASGRGVLMAIEDSGLVGLMKPVIVAVRLEEAATPDSPRRWPALAEPLPPDVYAGAPYLVRLSSRRTLLSVQSTEGRRAERMVVYVGDGNAGGFRNGTEPFRLPPDVAGRWNSLFVHSPRAITAVCTTTMEGTSGVWLVDGRLVE